MQKALYPIRIILIWQGLVLLLLGAGLGGGLFYLILKTGILPESLEHGIGTAMLVLVIGIVFLLTKQWLTIGITLSISEGGLQLTYDKDTQVFRPDDRFIRWGEVVSWENEHAHASAHTLSPPTLIIKVETRRSVNLMIAGTTPTYMAFLKDFEEKVAAENSKRPSADRIRRNQFYLRKATNWVLGSVYVVLLVVINYFVWFTAFVEGTLSEKIGMSLGFSLFCVFMIWVSVRNYQKGQKNEEN